MEQFKELQRDLALQQGINAQLDRLVRRANQTVLILGPKKNNLKENQLRNVVNVAANVESIEALLNFIRYQIAREQGWRTCRSGYPRDFGHQVIADIQDDVCVAATAAVRQASASLETKQVDETALFERAYLLLTEQYLGYLNRAFTYCEKAENINGYDELEKHVQARPCNAQEATNAQA